MLAMDHKTYKLIGDDYPGNSNMDVKSPSLGWMIGFMFAVSFLGLFSLVALRKVLVGLIPNSRHAFLSDYKLVFNELGTNL